MKRAPKIVPIGPALNTPPEELALLALITPEDIEAAKADAAAKMTDRGRALVEAAFTAPPEDDALTL